MITDADGSKVIAKKEAEKSSNADENKVDKKRESEKPCIVAINTSPSVSLGNIEKLTYGKYGLTGEGGDLVTQ